MSGGQAEADPHLRAFGRRPTAPAEIGHGFEHAGIDLLDRAGAGKIIGHPFGAGLVD